LAPRPDWRARLGAAPAGDALALAAGALLPLAFAPLALFVLAPLALALLFRLWLAATPRRALWRGWLFGLGVNGVGVSWVYVAIHDFGYASVPLALFLTTLFVAFLALYPALTGWLVARFLPGPAWWRLGLAFPAAWTLMEWWRGWFLTGFPWLNLGYSQIDAPLAGLAPLAGVYGLSLATALTAGLLALLFDAPRRARLTAAALIAALWLGAGLLARLDWTEPAGPPLKVALVQGNIPQDSKWRPELVQHTLDLYADLTRQHWDSRLILWPEAAVTAFYHEVADDYLAGLRREARAHGADLVLGIPVLDRAARRYYNSLLALGERPGFYHKRHLVPFGDFLPFEDWLRGLIRFFDLPMSGFSAGPADQPLLEAAGQKLASSICYEDAFGEELIRSLPEATLVVNVTNNAWYGDSFAPPQALQMSRLRALETGRTLLRATTNGVSAVIDARGRIVARSPQFQTAVLTASAEPRRGATPYVRLGNLPAVLLALALVLAGAWRARRRVGRTEAGVE
jgi:apolipoprotein N-acyltransferase